MMPPTHTYVYLEEYVTIATAKKINTDERLKTMHRGFN